MVIGSCTMYTPYHSPSLVEGTLMWNMGLRKGHRDCLQMGQDRTLTAPYWFPPPFPFSVRRKEIAGTWLESISGTSTRVIFPQQNDHVGVSQNVLFDRSRKRTVFILNSKSTNIAIKYVYYRRALVWFHESEDDIVDPLHS